MRHSHHHGRFACAALAVTSVLGAADAAPGDTTLVSVRQAGLVTAMGASSTARVSANGRYVAFRSAALDLVPGSTGGRIHGYVTDLVGGTVERVSVSSNETAANSDTDNLSISADGRFVAFATMASNLVPNDTNAVGDVFVRDRQSGLTQRVSVTSGGAQAGRASFAPCISGDGRYVAFGSRASNLVAGDTNNVDDVFLRDRETGQTFRISVANNGAQGNGSSFGCAFSADGRFVAFASRATNLVQGDTNAADDVFVRDLVAGSTERVSLNSAGVQGNGGVAIAPPAISTNGRFVAFASLASNLVPGDTNGSQDVFVRDRQTDQTERVSVNSSGAQMPAGSFALGAAVSADGRFVAFHATAPNLPGDGSTGIFLRDRLNSTTTRVSVNSSGAPGNSYSFWPSMSADARYIAFESGASNLVPGDGNGATDVFVRDRQAATLLVASRTKVTSNAAGSDEYLECCDETLTAPSVSNDGRFVAFASTAKSIVVGESGTPGLSAIYVRDVQNKQTIRVSEQGSIQNHAVISGNGRYVIFSDYGTGGLIEWDRTTRQSRVRVPEGYDGARVNYDARFLAFPEYRGLVPGDTNDTTDIYVHDRQSGGLERVSVSSTGTQPNSYSDFAEISADGRFVTFVSNASNLVGGDTNGAWDVFVRDRATAKTERVSVASNGAQANGYSHAPSLSADGRFVAFTTDASNLVAGDTVSTPDLFVHDRTTRQTTRVRTNGVAIPGASISADGRYLTFTTAAALLARDTNHTTDVYVVERSTGKVELMSQSSTGTPANGPSEEPSMSGNGRFVVFETLASNLGGKDLNGLTDVYLHERAVSSLTVAPLNLAFGRQRINTTSAAQAVMVTNVSTSAVPITSVALQGTHASQFARTHNCGSSLAAGASCTINVVFKPTSTGAKTATLNVNGTGGGLRSVALAGTGITG